MPTTCGQGLAERSPLLVKMSAVAAAMADTLEQHQHTLDLSDPGGRAERDAYHLVSSDLREAAFQLQAAADRMAEYRSLPMAPHDERALNAPENRHVFGRFIERAQDLVGMLTATVHRDREMWNDWSARQEIEKT